jgi:hypothetical protein
MPRIFLLAPTLFMIAASCATGGGLPDPGKDGGGVKDGGGGNDTGTTPDSSKDTGTPKDTGGPDVIDTCVKAPPSNVCGVFPQCDCTASQTCEVDQQKLDGSSSCVSAGTKGIGQACTGTASQCAPGLTCIWGQCHAYCGTDGSKCTNANTNYCLNLTDNSQNPIPNLLICHNDCQLEDPSSCGGGNEGCVYFDVDKVDCYPVGTTPNCTATSSLCPAGQVCLTDKTNYFCLPWCRVGQNDCKTGTCNTLTTLVVNNVTYGYCQ